MKRIVKKVLKRAFPAAAAEHRRLVNVEEKVNRLVEIHDRGISRLEQLQAILARVEQYQPAYHVAGVIDTPARDSLDRCRAIEAALKPLAGKRILDIGSSLGYFSFYLADRGAVVQGWEPNIENAEAARLIQSLNGIPVDFRTTELNHETVSAINPHDYDVTLLLNIAHHITRFHGLAYTQKLMRELLLQVPILIAELARKGEDPALPWDSAQPKDELAIFDLIKDDVTIEKIGDFGNHLSKKTRPLYIIKRRQLVEVNGHAYIFDEQQNMAYRDSPLGYHPVQRRYYFADDYIIKEYVLTKGSPKDTYVQMLNEIQLLTNLEPHHVHHVPKLLDFELSPGLARIVVARTKGVLLSDVGTTLTASELSSIVRDVLRSLKQLHELGINHNDVRSWNVIVSPEHTEGWLIDYGLASGLKEEDDIATTLQLLINAREGSSAWKAKPILTAAAVASHLADDWRAVRELYKSKHANPLIDQIIAALT